jgi:hypothetical protein
MKIITVRGQIREVAGKWKERYTEPTMKGLKWREELSRSGLTRQAIHERLLALDVETATPGDVAAVIGNDTWIRTSLICNECGRAAPALAKFTVDWTDNTVPSLFLCAGCLRKAADALDKETGYVG